MNVPKLLGAVISNGIAKRHELDTVYGTRDLYDFLEIIQVDAYNDYIANKPED